MKILGFNLLINTFLLFTLLTATSFAEPYVLPVKNKPFGQSYKEWAVDFSRWIYSIPYEINPQFNNNVTNCTLPQHGKVWFVTSAVNKASCVVPNGKAIFIQVGEYVDTYPCPDPNFKPAQGQSLSEFLTLDVKKIVDGFVPNELYIDGKPIVDVNRLPKLRLSTGLFKFRGNISLQQVDSCVTGKRQYAVTDGYFAMIDGLKPGKHTFDFHNSKTGILHDSLQLIVSKDRVNED